MLTISTSALKSLFPTTLILVWIILPTFAACSPNKDDFPKCYPVKGKVLYNGKPMVSAVLTFQTLPYEDGKWEQRKPKAIVKVDGSFELSTYKLNDGAPAGEYAMTIRWSADAEGLGPDLLKGRYRDAKSPARKFTFSEGENQLETIEITGPSVERALNRPVNPL